MSGKFTFDESSSPQNEGKREHECMHVSTHKFLEKSLSIGVYCAVIIIIVYVYTLLL